jgi:hypothetical protein
MVRFHQMKTPVFGKLYKDRRQIKQRRAAR